MGDSESSSTSSTTTSTDLCDLARWPAFLWLPQTPCTTEPSPTTQETSQILPTSCATLFYGAGPSCTEPAYHASGCPEGYTSACVGVYSRVTSEYGSRTYITEYENVYCCPKVDENLIRTGPYRSTNLPSFTLDCSALNPASPTQPPQLPPCILHLSRRDSPNTFTVVPYTPGQEEQQPEPSDATTLLTATWTTSPDPQDVITIHAHPTRHDHINETLNIHMTNHPDDTPYEATLVAQTLCREPGCAESSWITDDDDGFRTVAYPPYSQQRPIVGRDMGTMGIVAPIIFTIILILSVGCMLRPFLKGDHRRQAEAATVAAAAARLREARAAEREARAARAARAVQLRRAN